MSISDFGYSKDWTNPYDFPTYEDNEVQVREDMQFLFNELKEYINRILLPGLTADGAKNVLLASGQSVETAINDRYTKLEADTKTAVETNDLVKDWTLDVNTGVMTIIKKDGTTVQYDTALEKVPATFELVNVGNEAYLKITNVDGTSTQTNVTALLNQYNFSPSNSIAFSVTGTGSVKEVTASIRDNSITLDMLALDALTQIQSWAVQTEAKANAASISAESARASELNALNYKDTAQASASASMNHAESAKASMNVASSKATQATTAATSAQSWAVGGTGSRTGEDTNNAKYWSEQAKKMVGGDYATTEEVIERTTAAEQNANAYTDEKCSNMPDSLRYTNSLLYLMSGDNPVGLPVQIIGGSGGDSYSVVCISGYSTGSFTAEGSTNTFTIPNYSTTKVIFLVHENLSLVKGVNYSISDTGVVILAYTLNAGDTVYWSSFDTSYDANYLANKEIFEEAGSAAEALQESKKYTDEQLANQAPAYDYGTEDLTAGTSELETGKLYFVYE